MDKILKHSNSVITILAMVAAAMMLLAGHEENAMITSLLGAMNATKNIKGDK